MPNDSIADPETEVLTAKRLLIGWIVGWVLALAIIVPAEWARFDAVADNDSPWLFGINIDTTPFVILFLALPAFWLAPAWRVGHGRVLRSCSKWLGESPKFGASPAGSIRRCWTLAVIVGLVAFFNCWHVSSTVIHSEAKNSFGDLPPALHDEYSYEFQAKTFLSGRLSYPSHPTAARLFDQFHVVNEGRFASRYFPGTGAWLAPFVSLGHAHWAAWLATVLICMFVFGIGRELACNGVGLLAGLLAACSPGMLLFGNTLLAHQPTLVGLGLFLFSFFRLQRSLGERPIATRSVLVRASFAGCGLTFAMLCRPMTAAGIGLPFGIWIAWWLLKNLQSGRPIARRVVGGFAVPLVFGFGVLLIYNSSTTGDAFKSPYQLYTDIYTPRHAYGFNNVANAKPIAPDRVITNYDNWAENLDGARAAKNVSLRLIASSRWTVGSIVALISACVFIIGAARTLDRRWWLVPAAIVSLHTVHIPYWFEGILNWHYVFESGILLCLIVAAATSLIVRLIRTLNRPAMSIWWASVLLISVCVNLVDCSPFWGARLTVGVGEFGFAKLKHYIFEQIVERNIQGTAIVFVKHDPADRHIDYVNNDPALANEILIARYPAATLTETETVEAARSAFPDRRLFLFNAATNELRELR